MRQLTRHTAAEFVRKFRDEVVVDAVLQRSEDYDWSSVLHCAFPDNTVEPFNKQIMLRYATSYVISRLAYPATCKCHKIYGARICTTESHRLQLKLTSYQEWRNKTLSLPPSYAKTNCKDGDQHGSSST